MTHARPVRVGVFGAAGYAGVAQVALLAAHPHVTLVFATSDAAAGAPVPSTALRYTPAESVSLDADHVDAVFLALPHGVSATTAARAHAAGVAVLDLSADLRLATPEAYSTWYGAPHPHPELLPSVYGLPEMTDREQLRVARRVAVPGCYPTATLLALLPLVRAGALADDAPIIVDAKSGVTGAGRTPKPELQFAEVYGDVRPYNAGRAHRHVGEIEQQLVAEGCANTLVFVPHLLPVDRGLMVSVYVTLNYRFTSATVRRLYEDLYDGEPFIRVLPLGEQAALRHAVRTPLCAISLTPVTDTLLHITSVIDNLLKGTASQALQCFNLMFGFPESLGLL